MKEESQIEDMRAAVRGDRERAEQSRRRSLENVLVLTDPTPSEVAPSAPEPRQRGFRRLFKRR